MGLTKTSQNSKRLFIPLKKPLVIGGSERSIVVYEHDSTESIKIQLAENEIDRDRCHYCVIEEQGEDYFVARYQEKKTRPHVRMLPGGRYMVLNTDADEIRECRKRSPEEEYKRFRSSLKRSFNNLDKLIRSNFNEKDKKQQLHLVLTYREPVYKSEVLYRDFEVFWKRYKRHFKGHKLEYIVIVEPHDEPKKGKEWRGWHMHVLVKTDQEKIYSNNDNVTMKLWGNGHTKTGRLPKDAENYFAGYFTGKGRSTDKARKKANLTKYYTERMNIYRNSRGLKKPAVTPSTYSEVREKLGDKPSYSLSLELVKETEIGEEVVNRMRTDVYDFRNKENVGVNESDGAGGDEKKSGDSGKGKT